MDYGSVNNHRYIDVSNIGTALDSMKKGLSAAMPWLHVFTGCDFTTEFYRKGKMKSFEILQNDTAGTSIQFFNQLSSEIDPDQARTEKFICFLYGMKGNIKDVNEARYEKLLQITGRIQDQVNSNGYIHYKNISIPIYGEGRGRELTSASPPLQIFKCLYQEYPI